MTQVSFYNPEVKIPANGEFDVLPRLSMGHEAWTVRPFFHLRQLGYECQFTNRLPIRGVVIAHRDHLPTSIRPTAERYLVSVRADRLEIPRVSAEIVSNPATARNRQLHPCFYLPHYTLPGLRPRSSTRGEAFENLVYIGNPENLAPTLREGGEMRTWLEASNFRLLEHSARALWEDFEQADALLGIRDLRGNVYLHKPPTKLINAWQARVPAILGAELSYTETGRDGEDCFIVSSPESFKQTLLRLRDNPALRHAAVRRGVIRLAREFSDEAITRQWITVLEELKRRAHHWRRSVPLRMASQAFDFGAELWQSTYTGARHAKQRVISRAKARSKTT
jgi:hypothetical protein